MVEKELTPGRFKERSRERVARQLRAFIGDGVWASGDMLPGERELATVLNAPRDAVRDALAVLIEEGWIGCNGASRRRRVNGAPREGDNGALNSTVVLLTVFSLEPYQLHRQSGWSEYIDKGASSAIRQKGLHSLSFHMQRVESEWNRMLEQKPGGILVTDLFHDIEHIMSFLPPFSPQEIPVVTYGDSVAASRYDHVTSDHEAGGYLLAKALIENGCKRPVMIDAAYGSISYWFAERRRGFERALREAGLEVTPLVETHNASLLPHGGGVDAFTNEFSNDTEESRRKNCFETRARLLASFLISHLQGANRADALLASSDETVPLLMRACRLFGLEPNRDILVTGYDNFWLDIEDRVYEPQPPFLTIDKHNEELGRQMFELLWKRKNGELEATPQREVVSPNLVKPKTEK